MREVDKEIDYKDEYDRFWKSLVENEDGTLNLDQIMRELSDYSRFMDTATKVYCHVTENRISKLNTTAEAIISTADEVQAEMFNDWFECEIACRGLPDLIIELRQACAELLGAGYDPKRIENVCDKLLLLNGSDESV